MRPLIDLWCRLQSARVALCKANPNHDEKGRFASRKSGPITVGESRSWPVKMVRVADFYKPEYDRETSSYESSARTIAYHMDQMKQGNFDPVVYSHRYSPKPPHAILDGSHRIIAAHRLGLKHIPAHVEPGSKIWTKARKK